VALKTSRIKNVRSKVIKITTDCQNIGYFYHSNNLNCAAQNRRLQCCQVILQKQASNLQIKPKIGNLAEKQAQHTLARKFHKTTNQQEN